MATVGDLKDVLAALADQASSPVRTKENHAAISVQSPTAMQRHRKARRYVAAAASAVVVAAVVAVVAATAPSQPTRTTGATGQSRLTGYRWMALPKAPIPATRGATSVWTGSRFIVWGGGNAHSDSNAGAAFDPTTDTWQPLPTSPLTPRGWALSVWTGHQVLIVGGAPIRGFPAFDDGALYNPATKQWHMIAPLPRPVRGGGNLLWDGHRAIYATYVPAGHRYAAHVDTYDPVTNRWTVLPPLTLARTGLDAGTLSLIQHQIVLWMFGQGAYAYDAATHTWKPSRLAPSPHAYVADVIHTGPSLLFPGGTYAASGNFSMPRGPGAQYFLRSRTSREITPSNIDLLGTVWVWTGSHLLGTYQGATDGMGSHTNTGTTAAWNPRTNTWKTLRPAPGRLELGTWVWTGKELIGWGPTTGPGHRSNGLIFRPT